MNLRRVQMCALFVGASGLLIGCGAMPTSPSLATPASRIAPSSLSVVASNDDAPFTAAAAESFFTPFGTAFGTCDDTVAVNGKVHTVLQPNGTHYNFVDMKGVGTFGAQYVVTATNSVVGNSNAQGASESTVTTTFNIIGKGKASNSKFFSVMHSTVNANGEPTATFEHTRLSCN